MPRPAGFDFQCLPLAPFRVSEFSTTQAMPKSQNTSQLDISPKHVSHNVTVSYSVTGFVHTIRAHSKSYSYLSASGTSVRLRPSPLPGGKCHATHLAYTGPPKQLKLLSIVYVKCDLPDCTKAERSHRLAKQIRRSESETERDAWLSYCQKDFSTLGRRLWRTTSKRQSNTDIKFEYESMLSLASYSL